MSNAQRLADAGIEVKPLEWVWNGASFFASSIVREYRIAKTANKTNDRYMVTYLAPSRKSHTIGWIDGEGAAKAAAQADYTARILSALQELKP